MKNIMFVRIFKAIGAFFLDFIETAVMALAIFVIIYFFLFQPHQVKGNSMLPSFRDKEYLLTNKIVYRLQSPQRGDVIIFQAPQNKKYDYIKRIIGLPGEEVGLKQGKIYVNDSLLDESAYLLPNTFTAGSSFLSESKKITVPENSYFAVGDNRPHSSDSREWGCIPQENIIGKAWFRYWPLSEAGLIAKIAL